jgi:hypothetical protein
MCSCLVAYILPGNPEYVVVDTNHGIYLFYLVGAYILWGNTEITKCSGFPNSV